MCAAGRRLTLKFLLCINSGAVVLFLVMIYIFFPTWAELSPLMDMFEGRLEVETGRRAGFTGLLGKKPVTALVSGVGQVNTAQAATAVLQGGTAELVVMGGCAGAYAGSGLRVGDVAVATEEVYADLGVSTPDGWLTLEDIGLPLTGSDRPGVSRPDPGRRFNRFPLRVESYEAALKAACKGGIYFGPFLTVSTVSGTRERGDTLYKRFGALCENMEGAAAAQVSLLYDVPFIEVRGISNLVEDRDMGRWDVAAGAANCARAIEGFVAALGQAI